LPRPDLRPQPRLIPALAIRPRCNGDLAMAVISTDSRPPGAPTAAAAQPPQTAARAGLDSCLPGARR
jgi:hypothetical protein